jgi:hypothetical protein
MKTQLYFGRYFVDMLPACTPASGGCKLKFIIKIPVLNQTRHQSKNYGNKNPVNVGKISGIAGGDMLKNPPVLCCLQAVSATGRRYYTDSPVNVLFGVFQKTS